jgi:hypothetical protein
MVYGTQLLKANGLLDSKPEIAAGALNRPLFEAEYRLGVDAL